jgi:hypothetical protein
MNIKEIEKAVLNGELILEKIYLGKRYKNKYIWDDETLKIKEVKKIEFDGWSHRAVYKNNPSSGYRISKVVYKKLLKELSTVL